MKTGVDRLFPPCLTFHHRGDEGVVRDDLSSRHIVADQRESASSLKILEDGSSERAGSAGAGSVALDSIESLRFVAPHPEARRVPGDTHGRSDAATRFSPGGGQDNLGSFHLPPRQRPRPHPRLENPSIPPSQSQLLGRSSHGHQYRRPWHYGLETFVTVH